MKAEDKTRIEVAEMKYRRKTLKYAWMDYKIKQRCVKRIKNINYLHQTRFLNIKTFGFNMLTKW